MGSYYMHIRYVNRITLLFVVWCEVLQVVLLAMIRPALDGPVLEDTWRNRGCWAGPTRYVSIHL